MINKTIHQIHLSEMPNDLIKQCVSSWEVLKEFGFEIKIWNKDEVSKIIQSYYPDVYSAFQNARNFGEAGDIARYTILHYMSGYYVDWDVLLVHPKKFLQIVESTQSSGYLLIDPSNGTFAPEFLSANKGDALMKQLFDDIVEIYNLGTPPPYAPQYSGCHRIKDTIQKLQTVSQTIIPVKEVFEYDYSEIRDAEFKNVTRAAVHFWMHTWI